MLVGIILGIALIAFGWLEIVSPRRDEAAKLGSQISTAQAQLDSANQQAALARADAAAFKRNYATVASLGAAVPTDDNVPTLITQLQSAASSAHVSFQSLQVANGTNGSSTAAPGAASASRSNVPPDATVGPAGLPTMGFTFTFRGNFFNLSDFFGRIQQFVIAKPNSFDVSGRLMTLNSISLAPAASGFPQIVATVSATGYLTPANQGLTAGATPFGPSTSPTS
jgi:hypothetical protein